MIGLLILAQTDFGIGLLRSAEHVLGNLPSGIEALPIDYELPQEQLEQAIRQRLGHLDRGKGVLILADIYGASHTNTACRLLRKSHVELVSGVNLPMLIRVLNYRNLDMEGLIAKALTGGPEGIVSAPAALRKAGPDR
ncbi:MAG: PTS fructose transporter subunit IIA [Gammaproteobacteria bacterium]|nr:PTS fructose transporter subunit IIA [Gammaproteobacteria bacterium]